MAPLSTTPLNISELRSLARTFRAGVEGAKDNLEQLAHERGDELADLLRFPPANLQRALGEDNLAALLASTIEQAGRAQRDAVVRSRRDAARVLAARLGELSEHCDDGSVALDREVLGETLALWGSGAVAFGSRGTVDARRLRAILRECRAVTTGTVTLVGESLLLVYSTAQSRGMIRLHLHPVTEADEVLHVPLDTMRSRARGSAVLDARAPILDTPEPRPVDTSEPPPPLADDSRSSVQTRRRVGFTRRFVEAALAFALGATP
jgi:hypothetical protein